VPSLARVEYGPGAIVVRDKARATSGGKAMGKKTLIALADHVRAAGRFDAAQIARLADFCQAQNPAFKRDRWIQYVAGQCGPNGGKKK
jgi:hypothetical protein